MEDQEDRTIKLGLELIFCVCLMLSEEFRTKLYISGWEETSLYNQITEFGLFFARHLTLIDTMNISEPSSDGEHG